MRVRHSADRCSFAIVINRDGSYSVSCSGQACKLQTDTYERALALASAIVLNDCQDEYNVLQSDQPLQLRLVDQGQTAKYE